MEHKGCMKMQVPPCERHSGGQPGAGICAVCLQEKLTQLWRGEGDSNWKSDTYSVTPPAAQESCETQTQTPRAREPSPPSPSNYYKSSGTPCFPVVFRVRNLQRDDAHESSKSSKGFEREKIDRGYSLGTDGDDDGGDRGHQFSCEIKSIMKELAVLHEKKRSEKCVKKRAGSDNESPLAQRQYQEARVDVSQVPVSSSSGTRDTMVAPTDTEPQKAKPRTYEEDEDDDDGDRYQRATLCFNGLWPGGSLRSKLNLKWAKVLASPILSSNKIAPSKSDLLTKSLQMRSKSAVAEAREYSGRACEASGVLLVKDDVIGRTRSPGHQIMPSPDVAPLPPRYVHHTTDEDGGAPEIDKETAMRIEASRIAVLSWLQSIPSPKAAQFKGPTYPGLLDDLYLGNGVLEMCDEEEFEFERQSEDLSIKAPDFEPTEDYNQINSFGKFLVSTPQDHALSRFADIELAA